MKDRDALMNALLLIEGVLDDKDQTAQEQVEGIQEIIDGVL